MISATKQQDRVQELRVNLAQEIASTIFRGTLSADYDEQTRFFKIKPYTYGTLEEYCKRNIPGFGLTLLPTVPECDSIPETTLLQEIHKAYGALHFLLYALEHRELIAKRRGQLHVTDMGLDWLNGAGVLIPYQPERKPVLKKSEGKLRELFIQWFQETLLSCINSSERPLTWKELARTKLENRSLQSIAEQSSLNIYTEIEFGLISLGEVYTTKQQKLYLTEQGARRIKISEMHRRVPHSPQRHQRTFGFHD